MPRYAALVAEGGYVVGLLVAAVILTLVVVIGATALAYILVVHRQAWAQQRAGIVPDYDPYDDW